MKKVIPYIASQFQKDKIWLRRTKPSAREYQVLFPGLLSIQDPRPIIRKVQWLKIGCVDWYMIIG